MKVLIVYELVPEDTKFYIVDVSPKDWTWLRKTHGYYVNQVFTRSEKENEEACDTLATWLETRQEYSLTKGEPFSVAGIDAIVVTGLLL